MEVKWDKLRVKIKKLMQAEGVSAYSIAKKTDQPFTTVVTAINGTGQVYWDTAAMILAALSLDSDGSRIGGVPCETTKAATGKSSAGTKATAGRPGRKTARKKRPS